MEIISVTPKCGMCKSYFTPEFRRNGVAYKSCRRCLDLTKSKRNCEHGKKKSNCRECGGSSICEHNKIRSSCRECGGGSICEHDRRRSHCKECGGGSICEHNKRRSHCKECGGSGICQHDRQRTHCRECGGSQICQHNRERCKCRECGDEIHKSVLQMVYHSRESDKKSNRYDDANHITYEHVTELINQSENKCCYCKVELQFIGFSANMGTLERIDNTIGHIVENCMIACRTCNFSRVGDKSLLR